MNEELVVIVVSLFSCVIVAGLVALAVFLIKKSAEDVKESELAYNKILQSLPADKQTLFVMQYNSSKKNPTTAVLLTLFLGGLGAHKFYMGETGLGVLYLVFCWTYIPSIIAFIEVFTISSKVGKYNQRKAMEIASYIK